MATEFFAQSPVLAFPVLALLIFTMVFVAVVIRTLRMEREAISQESKLPLEEDHDV
jgi:cbb3-type cytochrome oxidase subunit 3